MYGVLGAAGPSLIVHALIAVGGVVTAGVIKLVSIVRHAKS